MKKGKICNKNDKNVLSWVSYKCRAWRVMNLGLESFRSENLQSSSTNISSKGQIRSKLKHQETDTSPLKAAIAVAKEKYPGRFDANLPAFSPYTLLLPDLEERNWPMEEKKELFHCNESQTSMKLSSLNEYKKAPLLFCYTVQNMVFGESFTTHNVWPPSKYLLDIFADHLSMEWKKRERGKSLEIFMREHTLCAFTTAAAGEATFRVHFFSWDLRLLSPCHLYSLHVGRKTQRKLPDMPDINGWISHRLYI